MWKDVIPIYSFPSILPKALKQLPGYVKQKGLGRQYYKDMILKLLSKEKKGVGRKDIDDLLMDMIPKASKAPKSYIANLLLEMKNKDHTIMLSNVLKITW